MPTAPVFFYITAILLKIFDIFINTYLKH